MRPIDCIVIALCLVVLLWVQWGLRRRYARWLETHRPEPASGAFAPNDAYPLLSNEPDCPLPFGYKTSWLAVRCGDPLEVVAALGTERPAPANWATGLANAANEGLFVSPCLSGWVLVVGYYESDRGLAPRLVQSFAQVQYFCTHRVTEYHRWVKYVDGALVRDYCWAGEQGKCLWSDGDFTVEENALGFADFPQPGEAWDASARLPDEEDVLSIAAVWGVDTAFAKVNYPPGLGLYVSHSFLSQEVRHDL